MALTFGTLLSSQGADAHRHDPFGTIRGNPRHITLVGRRWSNAQLRPASRLVAAHRSLGGASRLGDVRPASLCCSVRRTWTTLVSGRGEVKSGSGTLRQPMIAGLEAPDGAVHDGVGATATATPLTPNRPVVPACGARTPPPVRSPRSAGCRSVSPPRPRRRCARRRRRCPGARRWYSSTNRLPPRPPAGARGRPLSAGVRARPREPRRV
jgi:hypothetical protein